MISCSIYNRKEKHVSSRLRMIKSCSMMRVCAGRWNSTYIYLYKEMIRARPYRWAALAFTPHKTTRLNVVPQWTVHFEDVEGRKFPSLDARKKKRDNAPQGAIYNCSLGAGTYIYIGTFAAYCITALLAARIFYIYVYILYINIYAAQLYIIVRLYSGIASYHLLHTIPRNNVRMNIY